MKRTFAMLACCLLSANVLATQPAEVMVVGSMHRMHAEMPYYSYSDLKTLLLSLDPDVLCVELQPADLEKRPEEKNKREYPEAVYPLMDAGDYAVYAMEPPDPLFSRLLAPIRQADEAFRREHPEKAAVLDKYIQATYSLLANYWTSPRDVNDRFTDLVFRAKHEAQGRMAGPAETAGWEAWNRHFLSVILAAAEENPGKRIAVVVGAEHAYWLRRELRREPSVRLVESDEMFD